MHPLVSLVEKEVFPAESSDRLFNFYRDSDAAFDVENAAEIRRSNLVEYLNAAPLSPKLVLFAEAPGPRGCRFSGIPFTSEEQVVADLFPFKGSVSSKGGTPRSEYSANIVWGLLAPYFDRILIWNTVPLHPHKPLRPMSIRTPSAAEVREWGRLLPAVIERTSPGKVLAIGRIAERACADQDVACTYVRHPSQGGANLFREAVRTALSEF